MYAIVNPILIFPTHHLKSMAHTVDLTLRPALVYKLYTDNK
ncbi:hypothetical protein Mucpa_7109 [Mucilaginibacter paludis DSM 18603]|uniref:Uncharacterized protein n=1 Tax=Mucilaginibacter paludis DSM 18603 TaxID=714943 RepID=H1Y9W9_9SPHI|nr:hypothetical protein Mucpa_7109 [Mucilaginibacter paludis DSM 18603]